MLQLNTMLLYIVANAHASFVLCYCGVLVVLYLY